MPIFTPQVALGTLNRARGTVLFPDFPELNITAPFLGTEGINVTLDGPVTDNLDTMTGLVPSPAIYQRITVEVELLKSQSFSDLWKQQIELLSYLGNFTVITDADTLSNYEASNGSIIQAGPGRINGKSVQFMVSIQGAYSINAALFNQA